MWYLIATYVLAAILTVFVTWRLELKNMSNEKAKYRPRDWDEFINSMTVTTLAILLFIINHLIMLLLFSKFFHG